MQTDVKSAHLNASGFMVPSRTRIKSLSIRGSATLASQVDFFSTNATPVDATYAQSGTTVTITSTAHGLTTGAYVGIAYTSGTGGSAINGNYVITVTGTNTFTVTSLNSRTITSGAVCTYVINGGSWLMSFDLLSGDTYQNYFLFPGEGVLATQQVYAVLTNLGAATIFYG